MDATRRAAVRLAQRGKVVIEQKQEALHPDEWDKRGRPGIVRIRLEPK